MVSAATEPAPPLVAFLHVPKTAGVTFTNALRRVYPAGSIVVRNGPGPEVLRAEPLGPEVRVVSGHLAFGVHEVVDRPVAYLTILREPVERVISAYRYVRRSASHPLHQRMRDEGIGLAAYVRDGYEPLNVDNGHVRLLSGRHDVGFGTCDEQMLEAAKQNLAERFAVVGLTERLDQSLAACRIVLGWRRRPRYRSANVAPGRHQAPEVATRTLARICEHNQLDIELYRFACDLFVAQQEELGARLRRELTVFRTVQSAYTAYQRALGDTRLGRRLSGLRSRRSPRGLA